MEESTEREKEEQRKEKELKELKELREEEAKRNYIEEKKEKNIKFDPTTQYILDLAKNFR